MAKAKKMAEVRDVRSKTFPDPMGTLIQHSWWASRQQLFISRLLAIRQPRVLPVKKLWSLPTPTKKDSKLSLNSKGQVSFTRFHKFYKWMNDTGFVHERCVFLSNMVAFWPDWLQVIQVQTDPELNLLAAIVAGSKSSLRFSRAYIPKGGSRAPKRY